MKLTFRSPFFILNTLFKKEKLYDENGNLIATTRLERLTQILSALIGLFSYYAVLVFYVIGAFAATLIRSSPAIFAIWALAKLVGLI